MTNVEALKALYVAFGGNASSVANMNTSAEVISALALIVPTAIAPELPKVTSSNNGQVLTVDGGKWKAKALPD